jgi:hypothetical protein
MPHQWDGKPRISRCLDRRAPGKLYAATRIEKLRAKPEKIE